MAFALFACMANGFVRIHKQKQKRILPSALDFWYGLKMGCQFVVTTCERAGAGTDENNLITVQTCDKRRLKCKKKRCIILHWQVTTMISTPTKKIEQNGGKNCMS